MERVSYSDEVAKAVCDHIADGKSLRSFCAIEGNPAKSSVMLWLSDHEDFRKAYAVAREMSADSAVDDMLDIADDKDLTPEDRRVRIWARQWTAGRMAPRKYGDRLELAGQVTVARPSRQPQSEDEWEAQNQSSPTAP